MVRRLCIFFLVALCPGLALAQSAALMEAFNRYKALDAQGRYRDPALGPASSRQW